ncbi:ExeA family protein [Noviherbaspirillum galbum]|uniref:AAA family ATPase n=1 Tax=Noviherbaspirillum galbum TaxID=2709383 RepID=A0A6B3SPV0_9BURK|nr:ExeA family protein [Noviherbaspirillum galbum]NEX60746.1 AAA family ATPase [Noviherbaspirillum galbum]
MYTQFFRLNRDPFSISPDPRFLFMSQSHHEALAHLMYGANSGGGVVVLTGEIGAGKTTVCRCFLEQVPENCNVGYIFNPRLTVHELLRAICEEFHIAVPQAAKGVNGVKDHIDALNAFLLDEHARGRNTVLIIDEAQNLAVEVLEQLRLLTNLETNERKLLQIILIGQPELRDILARPDLEQLAQRVIARYHLGALTEQETASYIQHRLSTSGLTATSPFQQPLMRQIHQLTRGVPRRINLLCDRALLGAYSMGRHTVDRDIIRHAAQELFAGGDAAAPAVKKKTPATFAAVAAIVAAGALAIGYEQGWMDGLAGMLPAVLRTVSSGPAASGAPAGNADKKGTGEPATPTPAASATSQPAPAGPSQAAVDAPDSFASQEAGIRRLAAMWGDAVPDGAQDPCEAIKPAKLRCYRSEGGLAELRLLDRPALLPLKDAAGKTSWLLLTGLEGQELVTGIGATAKTISMAALTRQYHGGFLTIWRVPPEFDKPPRIGDSGPQVDWIASQLAQIYGGAAPAEGQAMSERMMAQIKDFQSSQGLHVDGIAGAVTLMHLNRMAGVAEPALHAARQPAATMNSKAGA